MRWAGVSVNESLTSLRVVYQPLGDPFFVVIFLISIAQVIIHIKNMDSIIRCNNPTYCELKSASKRETNRELIIPQVIAITDNLLWLGERLKPKPTIITLIGTNI